MCGEEEWSDVWCRCVARMCGSWCPGESMRSPTPHLDGALSGTGKRPTGGSARAKPMPAGPCGPIPVRPDPVWMSPARGGSGVASRGDGPSAAPGRGTVVVSGESGAVRPLSEADVRKNGASEPATRTERLLTGTSPGIPESERRQRRSRSAAEPAASGTDFHWPTEKVDISVGNPNRLRTSALRGEPHDDPGLRRRAGCRVERLEYA